MLGSGSRRNRVSFQRRGRIDDGYGNEQVGEWGTYLTCWAACKPTFGREQVEAGRLESSSAGTVTVLKSAISASIIANDRIVFEAGPYAGKTANIRSVIFTNDNREVELTIEEGVSI